MLDKTDPLFLITKAALLKKLRARPDATSTDLMTAERLLRLEFGETLKKPPVAETDEEAQS